jgi:methyl-coenzyme M reductase subunit D
LSKESVKPEIEIIPRRLLGKITTRKLVNLLDSIPDVTDVLLNSIDYEDGSGSLTKRIIVRVKDGSKIEPILLDIDGVCRNLLPAGHDIRVGRFTKPRPTVSDYLK